MKTPNAAIRDPTTLRPGRKSWIGQSYYTCLYYLTLATMSANISCEAAWDHVGVYQHLKCSKTSQIEDFVIGWWQSKWSNLSISVNTSRWQTE
jgi:hypothetical protein